MTRVHRSTDTGFSLAEVLIALTLLAVAAMGMVDLLVRSARVVAAARQHTLATTLAIDRLEQLLGLTLGFGDAQAPTLVIDDRTDLTPRSPGTGGTGISFAPAGVLDVDTPGWTDVADVEGGWAGVNPGARTARFVRRWRVSALPRATGARVLEVSVRAARVADAGGGQELVRLVAVKSPTAY